MKRLGFMLIFLMAVAMFTSAFAYNIIPPGDSGIKYFYVFGPKGDTDLGAEADHELTFYIDVPEYETKDIVISVFDPDTGGNRDFRARFQDPWDTVTEFSVYGEGNKILDSQKFGSEKDYDKKYFQFGPYSKTQGQKIGNSYRFRLDAKAISGDDGNLFSLRISPDSTEVFSYKITFRLTEREGEKMHFYPEIRPRMTKLVINNYDLDINGGTSRLYDPELKRYEEVSDSLSAQWAETSIPVNTLQPRRLEYVITKKTQKYGNAGLEFKDDQGNPVPIFFKYNKPQIVILPQEKVGAQPCNTFTFDGTKSYAHDNKVLSYEWDFGDGTTAKEPVVTHVFEKAGEYTVKLVVRDDSGLICDNASATDVIAVNTPPQPAFTNPEMICAAQEITFDASATQDNTPGKLTYRWDFGDGTLAEGKRVTKTYLAGGLYKVTLSVNDNSETSCNIATITKTVKVNIPPVIGKHKDIDMCISSGQEYKVDFGFVGAGSGQQQADKLIYTWDFDDGTTGQGKNVTHVYQRGGRYTAKLKVDDGSGLPCSAAFGTINVNLNQQPFANAGEDILTCIGNNVNFNASGSRVEDGSSPVYTWDFGDGSTKAQGIQVSHTYKKPGTYQAKLTVDDRKNTACSIGTDTVNVSVNSGPNVAIVKVYSGCTGKPINFDASKSRDVDGDYLKYVWDFGDGTVTEGRANITHTFQKGGEYLVKVTADDQKGTSCSQSSTTLKVKINAPPVANAGPNLVCCTNAESVFDGSGSFDPDGDTLTYTWDFGDGSTAKGAKVTHIYTKNGNYKVTLKVDDNSGMPCSSSTSSFTASVHERPVSVIKVR